MVTVLRLLLQLLLLLMMMMVCAGGSNGGGGGGRGGRCRQSNRYTVPLSVFWRAVTLFLLHLPHTTHHTATKLQHSPSSVVVTLNAICVFCSDFCCCFVCCFACACLSVCLSGWRTVSRCQRCVCLVFPVKILHCLSCLHAFDVALKL